MLIEPLVLIWLRRAKKPICIAIEIIIPIRSIFVWGEFTRYLRLPEKTRPVLVGGEHVANGVCGGKFIQRDGLDGDIGRWVHEIWQVILLHVIGELGREGRDGGLIGLSGEHVVLEW